MEIVLKVFGVLFIGLLAVVTYYGWKVCRWFKKLKDQIIASTLTSSTPSRITLKEPEDRSWMEQEEVKKQVQELRSLGYSDSLPFVVEEMYGLEIIGQAQEQESIYSVTYLGHDGAVWVDLFSENLEGNTFTVTNTKIPMKLDTRPGKSIIVEPGLDINSMQKKLLSIRGAGPFKTTLSADFKGRFETAYAEDMDWRNSRGGSVTWEEFQRTAHASDHKLTQEQLREAYFNSVYAAGVLRLSSECVEVFQKQGNLANNEEPNCTVEPRGFFALHQHIPGTHFEKFIKDHIGGLDDSILDQFKPVFDATASAQENFSRLIRLLPAEVRPEKVGSVDFPVTAEIFKSPICPEPAS